MTVFRRASSAIRRGALDAVALVGLVLVAYGFGLYSEPLFAIVLGLGCLAAVRFGGR